MTQTNGRDRRQHGKPGERKENVTIRMSASILAAVEKLAASDRRSLSNFVGKLCEDHVARSRAA
jgi:hypothetical protein